MTLFSILSSQTIQSHLMTSLHETQVSHLLFVPKGTDDYLSEGESEEAYDSRYVSDDESYLAADKQYNCRNLSVYCAEVDGGIGVFFDGHEILNVSAAVAEETDRKKLSLIAIIKALEQCKAEDVISIHSTCPYAVQTLDRLTHSPLPVYVEDDRQYRNLLEQALAQIQVKQRVEVRYLPHEHHIPGIRKAHLLAGRAALTETASVAERVKNFYDPWACAC